MPLQSTTDHTSVNDPSGAIRSSPYSLWPSDKLQKNVLKSMPQTQVSKENLPMWQRHPTPVPFRGHGAVLSAAPSLNVQRLRARPSMDIGLQKLAPCKADIVQQYAVPRLESKRRKSIHKRVMSKVKDGVLSRSKSSSKFFGTLGLDERKSANTTPAYAEDAQQRSSKLPEVNDDVRKVDAKHSIMNPVCGDLTLSMLQLDSSTRSASRLSTANGSADRTRVSHTHDLEKPTRRLKHPPVVPATRSYIPNPSPVFIMLSVRPSSRHFGVDDGMPSWFTVTAKVLGNVGEIRSLTLSIEAGMDGLVHTILGPLNISSMSPGDVTELRVKLSPKIACRELKRRDSCYSTHSVFDDLCSELESMLGDALTELMVVKARYTHSLFPKETSLATEYSLKVRVSDPKIPAPSVNIGSTPAYDSKTASSASSNSLNSPSASPPSSRSNTSITDDDKTVHHNVKNPSTPTQPSPDAARKVWTHMRRDSKSAADVLDLEPAKTEDEAVTAMRQRALSNKRSVGAETLRDWQTMAGSHKEYYGGGGVRMGHVPWL